MSRRLMINKFKDKYFWTILLMITGITFLHYSNIMAEWELHIFYRKLYYIPIIFSSFRYRFKGGMFASILISILYAPHIIFYTEGLNITLINQYLEIILFISIGFITGRLVESDFKRQESLEKKVIEITKLQNYTKNIVDSIGSGVLSIDNNNMITSINKEGENILNLTGNERLSILELLKDKMLIDALKQVRVQKKPITNIHIDADIGEDNKHLVINIAPLLDILKRVQGLVMVIEDKSREKDLEAQAIRADRLSTVGELASGIAHEIRNPLGIIKTISQVLQEEDNINDIKEGLSIIEKEIDRANVVIKSMLNFAKPQTTQVENFSLKSLLEEINIITEKYAKQQGVAIKFDTKKDLNISADKEKLKQVFINIIFNSVQAMPSGGEIIVESTVKTEWVNIKIIDNGYGISKENLKKIFNPFFTTKEKGTGLGLSISNRIIQDHKGYINIYSVDGKGTTVDIFLPLKKEVGEHIEE